MKFQETSLKEENFIHEEYLRNPFPFWFWSIVILAVTTLMLSSSFFYYSKLSQRYTNNPFLRVTNRQLSLFLWQNPQYMRIHVKRKNGYLPAFEYAERIGLNPNYAEDYAVAPPELLFMYHTWERLLGKVVFPRSIHAEEFSVFLTAAIEWSPRYWLEAPKSYVQLVDGIESYKNEDLSALSEDILPICVKQAFVGWKNYFREGDQINSLQPTKDDISKLVNLHVEYARSNWKAIIGENYLNIKDQSQDIVPSEKLSSFLRIALYNFKRECILPQS